MKKKLFPILVALSSLFVTPIAWASPLLQEPAKISDTQMVIAIIGFVLVTAGAFYFVWKFYPREEKKPPEEKK